MSQVLNIRERTVGVVAAGRVAIKDVAAAARVSIKTVSRVVNGVSTVDPAMRERVEKAIAALDYVPSPTARSLRTGTGSVVGVVVDSIDDPFFSRLVSAVEDGAVQMGVDVVIASTRFNAAREREQLMRLAAQRPRGIILAPTGEKQEFLRPYRAKMPVVTVDRSIEGFDSVTVDDYAAARVAVQHLATAGHRRIALLGHDPRFQTARSRRAGYEEALREHDLAPDPRLMPEVPYAGEAAKAALHALLALADPPTALFLASARQAPTVVSAVHELGRTDLAMVSFGDFALADAVRPAISCINQDPYLIGSLAFERLVELTASPHLEPEHRVVATSFIARSSLRLQAPPAVGALPRAAVAGG